MNLSLSVCLSVCLSPPNLSCPSSGCDHPHPSIRRALPQILRYYLKNNLSSEPLIPDELIGQLLAESKISLVQLEPREVAWQLTLNDYKVFREIEPTEYVDDLYGLDSKFGCLQLHKFAEVRGTFKLC